MKIKISKGLKLNKELITKLQESQTSQFKGGIELSGTCQMASCFPPSCNKTSCKAEEIL